MFALVRRSISFEPKDSRHFDFIYCPVIFLSSRATFRLCPLCENTTQHIRRNTKSYWLEMGLHYACALSMFALRFAELNEPFFQNMNNINEDFNVSGSLVDEDFRHTELNCLILSTSPLQIPDQDRKPHFDKCHTEIKVKSKVPTLAWFYAISRLYFIPLTRTLDSPFDCDGDILPVIPHNCSCPPVIPVLLKCFVSLFCNWKCQLVLLLIKNQEVAQPDGPTCHPDSHTREMIRQLATCSYGQLVAGSILSLQLPRNLFLKRWRD